MLLSIDASAVTASVALTDNDCVIKSEFVNAGLTHSETLLPESQRESPAEAEAIFSPFCPCTAA